MPDTKTVARLAARVTDPRIWDLTASIPADAGIEWPSVLLDEHAAGCDHCFGDDYCHRAVAVSFPAWWWSLMTRGATYDRNPEQAITLAIIQINNYRGHPLLKPKTRAFVRQAVIDALCMGPSPMTPTWVKYTLAPASGLVRWSIEKGLPLSREAIFNEENIRRWLQNTHHSPGGAASYLSRMMQLAALFTGATTTKLAKSPVKKRSTVDEPHSPREIAQMWHWTTGLKAAPRHRVQAYLVLGLGVGLKLEDKVRLTRDDVTIDSDGAVHVTTLDTNTGELRTITCLADWEDELTKLVQATPVGAPVLTPWRTEPSATHTVHNLVERARRRGCPVHFNGRSLRNTWTVAHLAAGTPIEILRSTLGIKAIANFEHLLRWVPEADQDTTQRALRGVRTH